MWLEEEEEANFDGGKSIFHQSGFGVEQMNDEELDVGYLTLTSSTTE